MSKQILSKDTGKSRRRDFKIYLYLCKVDNTDCKAFPYMTP